MAADFTYTCMLLLLLAGDSELCTMPTGVRLKLCCTALNEWCSEQGGASATADLYQMASEKLTPPHEVRSVWVCSGAIRIRTRAALCRADLSPF